jgi:hypothetical protein
MKPCGLSCTNFQNFWPLEPQLLCWIWDDYEECRLLGCGTMWVYYKKTFWRNVSSHLQGLTLFLAHVISSTLKMEATRFSHTSVRNRPTLLHITEDSILQTAFL